MNNPHFAIADSWSAAEAMLTFRPVQPSFTAGFDLQALRIHICDHRMRELPIENRTLEAHYGGFVFSQARVGAAEARRLALAVVLHGIDLRVMSGAHYWLTSDRLALRRFTPDDIDWLADLYSDPDVTRYLGGVKNRTRSEELLRTRILQYYDEHPGLGIWMTVERETGTCLGFHLLNHIRGESIIQTGFTLVKPAWGKGFATEMAATVLRYGFVDLKLPRIAGMASLQNYASQRVLLKIGLERRGERAFSHPDYASEGPMAWFERDAVEWLADRAHAPTEVRDS